MDTPNPPIERLLILGNGRKPEVAEQAETIRRQIESLGAHVVGFDLSGQVRFDQHAAQMVIVLGGDGAILRAAHQLGAGQIPVLGVNLGRLGFLADLMPDAFQLACPDVLTGNYHITRHVMLDCLVRSPAGEQSHLVLNEVVVSAGPPFRILDVELLIDGEPVTTFSGDGLIISTPIGSTAHSLAAGGPILVQDLPAVVITPISPHALTWRPIVESAQREFLLRCPNPSEGTTLIIDGQVQLALTADQDVRLHRAPVDFQLTRLTTRSYYRTLTEKLHWGARPAETAKAKAKEST